MYATNTSFDSNCRVCPAFPEQAVAIALASSNSFAPLALTMVASLLKCSHSQNVYDIVVLTDCLDTVSVKLFEQQAELHPNVSVRVFHVGDIIRKQLTHCSRRTSIQTFYRLFIGCLFDSYQRVVYLDSDLILKADIAELYSLNLECHAIAAARDLDWLAHIREPGSLLPKYASKALKMRFPESYFQAGVMVVDIKKYIRQAPLARLIKLVSEKDYLYFDQDILNMVFDGEFVVLPQKWNVLTSSNGERTAFIQRFAPTHLAQEYLSARNEPKIIHYAGHVRPWLDKNSDYAEDFWDALRQTPYRESVEAIASAQATPTYPQPLVARLKHMITAKHPSLKRYAKKAYYYLKGWN